MSDHQMSLFFEGGIQCDKCGEISPNQYVHTLNHSVPYGSVLCRRQDLALRHIKYWIGGEGHPTAQDFITQARNLNIPPHHIEKAIRYRKTRKKDTP